MSAGIVVGVLFITVAQPKHSQFCAKCHNNISFNNACKKSLSEDIGCIECHTHENKGMTVMATEIRDTHCTNDLCHPLTKLSAMPVHYKGLKPFQHKTHLAINLNQITLLSPDHEEVKNSPDGKVFTREDTKDKFIVTVQHPHRTSPIEGEETFFPRPWWEGLREGGELIQFIGKLRLRCTSCHANTGGEKHFETDTSTCNTCHFISQLTTAQSSSPISPLFQEKNSLCEGLTINNLNKFVVRYFEDSGTSTGSVQALSGLKPNSDKTVTNPSLKAGVNPPAPYTPYNPSLKAGVSGYTPYRGFSPDGTTTRSCSCYLLSITKSGNMQQSFNTKDEKSISNCTLCHDHIEKSKEIYGKIFKHDAYEKSEKVSCTDCHFKTIQGNGKVDKRSCYQCHPKIANNFNNASDMHYIHIDKHKTPCTSCHTSITHGWVRANDKIYGDSNTEHVDMEYKIQNLIIMGLGGMGIKGEPDPMHLATLNCSACHKDKQPYTNVASEVCNNCHNRGFDKMLSEQLHFVTSKMQRLRTLLVKAKRFHNSDTYDVSQYTIIHEAEANYNLIKGDGSFGVHNIKYVKDLLDYSIAKLTNKERFVASSNVPVQRPHLTSPLPLSPPHGGQGEETFSPRHWWEGLGEGGELIPSNKSPFPTSSCIDRCHVNYIAYRTIYQKEIFRHKMHSPDQDLECYQCHNNDPIDKKTHGNLILQNKDCQTCHHQEASDNDCLKCHSEVQEYINGGIQNIVTKKPDWMSKSVSCTDCHKLESDGASFKAVREYCIECHNPDYGLLYDAWKDVLDSKTKQLYKNNTNTLNIQNPLRLVQSYGVHNFRLSQMLLKSMDHD